MTDASFSPPASVAATWQMLCPSCLKDDQIHVKALVTVMLTHDGTESIDSDTEWDNASITHCDHCGYTATVKDFSEAFDKLHGIDA